MLFPVSTLYSLSFFVGISRFFTYLSFLTPAVFYRVSEENSLFYSRPFFPGRPARERFYSDAVNVFPFYCFHAHHPCSIDALYFLLQINGSSHAIAQDLQPVFPFPDPFSGLFSPSGFSRKIPENTDLLVSFRNQSMLSAESLLEHPVPPDSAPLCISWAVL